MKRVHQVLNFFTGFETKSKRDMVHNEMKARHMGISSCSQTRLLVNPLHESVLKFFASSHFKG